MKHSEALAIVRNATYEFYQLGMCFKGSRMIPLNADNSISLDAGPLRFVVEPRILDDTVVATQPEEDDEERAAEPIFNDYGPSLHVFAVNDGLEYLRFDCFLHKPHYHYGRYGAGEVITVRIDQYAEGDPVEWTIGRLRSRLPEMLEYAGVAGLADDVRAHAAGILEAVNQIETLLRKAKDDDLLKEAKEQISP
jgi:hypothetical protein